MAGQSGMTEAYEWRGRNVVDSEGDKLGKLDEIYLDQESGEPEWALVDGGGLFGSKSNFVPLQGASPAGEDVKLNFTQQQIKDAPGVEADASSPTRRSRSSAAVREEQIEAEGDTKR